MSSFPLPASELVLLFELLDRRSAARLSRTCKYVYEIFCQLHLREPDELAFAFDFSNDPSSLPVPTRPSVIHCFTSKQKSPTVHVSILLDGEPQGLVIFNNGAEYIWLHRRDDRNFTVWPSKATSCKTLFKELFNFFKAHLPTKAVIFNVVSEPIIETLSNWIHVEERKCKRLLIDQVQNILDPRASEYIRTSKTSNQEDATELVMNSIQLIRPRFLQVDVPASFSHQQMTSLANFVEHFQAAAVALVEIDEEEFRRWSPSHFKVRCARNLDGETVSLDSVMVWIADCKRAHRHGLLVNVRQAPRDVYLALKQHFKAESDETTLPWELNVVFRRDDNRRFRVEAWTGTEGVTVTFI